MNVASLKPPCLRALCLLVLASMTGCNKDCLVGREVVIPSSDTTDPAVVLDFHLPSGQIVSASPNSVPSAVTVPGGGTVTIIAKASDDQDVKDVQLWVSAKTCSVDRNTRAATCSGRGFEVVPVASNGDTRTAGQNGCTERLVSHNLVVNKTPRGSVSYKVVARGVNFGGRDVLTPNIRLNA